MNHCPSCGAEVPASAQYCPECGNPLQATALRPAGNGQAAQSEEEDRIIPYPFLVGFWIIVILTIFSFVSFLFLINVRKANTPWPNAEYPAFYSQNGVANTLGSFTENTEAIQTASRSVVRLDSYDETGEWVCSGSAFAALEDGLFVTNWHVIEDAVEFRGKMEYGAVFDMSELVAFDAKRDLAILRASSATGILTLPLGISRSLEMGAKVLTLGSPLGMTNVVSSGLYSGTFHYRDDESTRFLLHTALTSNGSSGGPLFNDVGEVIGVHRGWYKEGQNLGLAVPIEDVIELYQSTVATAK